MHAVIAMPRKYTDEEINEMIALHEHGYTATEIAEILCRDRNTIARELRDAGIKLKTGEGWRKRKLTPEREIELVCLYGQEVPIQTLCEQFNVGRTYVYALLKKHNYISHAERERQRRLSDPRTPIVPVRESPNPVLKGVYAIRDRNRQYLYNYYKANPCVDCGESDPIVLELDHVRGEKKAGVSQLVHNTTSLKRIDEEISKCDVVCANCHRRRTAITQGWHLGLEV